MKKITTIVALSFGLISNFGLFNIETVYAEDAEKQIQAPKNVYGIPANATVLPSGVAILTLAKGDGKESPTLTDDVTIHYTGWQTDGKMFDSSRLRGKPSTFPLGRLIAGWQKAVPHMTKGEILQIWIPGDLAYDLRTDRPTAPKGMLVFEIELFDFVPSEAPESK